MNNATDGEKSRSTYRRIVSSTAVFGGAHVFSILINIIRAKLVALILHSKGMGFSAIISNAANTLQQVSMLGLNIAAVPDISKANAEEDEQVLAYTIRIVRRLVLVASIVGVVLTVSLSPLISKLSFGTTDYTPYFLLLAASIFFNVLGTGEMAVLQGLRRYKLLAFCSTVPPICGLLISIPIYFIWGVEGIVPAMIVVNVIYFIVIRILSYRVKRQYRERISIRQVWTKGRDIIKFGFVMTIGTVVGTLGTYALFAFISNTGSIDDAGFYYSASIIASQYIGLIFTAMAADYFPHLSGLLKTDKSDAFRLVNKQTEILLLIMGPLIMLFILSAPLAIRILLTDEFLCIEDMVRMIGVTGVFRAIFTPMDYIAYAKGDRAYIFWVETVFCSSKTFAVMALSYHFMGMEGLGYGALVSSVIDLVVTLTLIPWRYGYRLTRMSVRLTIIMILLTGTCLACSFIGNTLLSYSLMGIITAAGTVFCLIQLDKRIDLRSLAKHYLGRTQKEVVSTNSQV